MIVFVCVFVCEGVYVFGGMCVRASIIRSVYMYLCVSLRVYVCVEDACMCVCVCVCVGTARRRVSKRNIYIYIYI